MSFLTIQICIALFDLYLFKACIYFEENIKEFERNPMISVLKEHFKN
jgi:hypothetical protein